MAHSNAPHLTRTIRAGTVPLGEPNDATLNLASNLGIFPAASVGAGTPKDIALPTSDIISRGIISSAVAEQCLTYFLEHLNRYLHGILSDRVTLSELLERSPILTAAICTVASFCSASDAYQSCYDAFVSQVSGMLFATRSSYDDVRALCIAALWLDDIGPTLSGLGKRGLRSSMEIVLTSLTAVRIGSQLDLHRCITKMPHTKVLCYDRTRLFYQLCLCDHQCSLKYGRPPMTRDWRSLKSPTIFLHSEFSGRRDLGLISQLELWNTTRAVFEQFGADVESSAACEKLDELDKLGQAYQNWHHTWCDVFGVENPTGSITELYYHCALLYLYSHVHRGANRSPQLSIGARLTEIHGHFRNSAQAILRIVTEGQIRILDLPSYFGTMLAFATVSLIKITRDGAVSANDRHDVLSLLRRLSDTFREIKLPQTKSHPYSGIAKGLEQTYETLHGGGSQSLVASNDLVFDDIILMDDVWNMDFAEIGGNWMEFNDH